MDNTSPNPETGQYICLNVCQKYGVFRLYKSLAMILRCKQPKFVAESHFQECTPPFLRIDLDKFRGSKFELTLKLFKWLLSDSFMNKFFAFDFSAVIHNFCDLGIFGLGWRHHGFEIKGV